MRSPRRLGATPALLPDGARLGVSHAPTGSGASGRHSGFVRVPVGAAALPVLVVHHGDDSGVSATSASPSIGVTATAQAFLDT